MSQDVFLSYAHQDDLPELPNQQGWVSIFQEAPRRRPLFIVKTTPVDAAELDITAYPILRQAPTTAATHRTNHARNPLGYFPMKA